MRRILSLLAFSLAVLIAAPAMATDLSPPMLGEVANLSLVFGHGLTTNCTASCADIAIVFDEETTCGMICVYLASGSSRSSPACTMAESGAILTVEMIFFDEAAPTAGPPGWEACTCMNEPINGVEATGRSGPHEGFLMGDCFGASTGHSIAFSGGISGSPTIDQGARDFCQDIIWNREPAATARSGTRDFASIPDIGQIAGMNYCGTTNSHPDGFDLRRTNVPPARNLPMRC